MKKDSKNQKQVAINLKRARLNANLTQETLASLVFVSRSTIAKYESGDLEPDSETRKKLADTLKIKESLLNSSSLKKKRIFTLLSLTSFVLISSLVPLIHFTFFEHSKSSDNRVIINNLNNEINASYLTQSKIEVLEYCFSFNNVARDENNNLILNKNSSIEISNLGGLFTFEIDYDLDTSVYFVLNNNYPNYSAQLSSLIADNHIIYTFAVTSHKINSVPKGATSIFITNNFDKQINIGKIKF